MSFDALLTRECTIIRRSEDATADEYGDPVMDDDAGELTLCEFQQATSSEDDLDQAVAVEYRVFLPADTAAIQGGDALTVDGVTYEFEGDANPVWNPRTRGVHHVEARVRRVD